MSEHFYLIHPEIFQKYPGYVRGIVVFQDLQNGESPIELLDLLRQEEDVIRNRMNIETIKGESCIASWREAFRAFGSKPGEYRSSIEAMIRRILRGDSLPSINALVDIGNIISLRHLLPVGGHAIDNLEGDLSLRMASGEEVFFPPGTDDLEQTEIGEVIFSDGDTVLTRRWTWRQGRHTLTLPETQSVEFNLDGLPPVGQTQVMAACHDLVELVRKYCQGTEKIELLSEFHPRISLAR